MRAPVNGVSMARQQQSACTGNPAGFNMTRAGEACLEQSEEGSKCSDAPGVREAQEAGLRDQRHTSEAQQNGNAHRPVEKARPLVNLLEIFLKLT